MFAFRVFFVSLQPQNGIGVWCNGNTTDSGPVIPGSNPGTPTQSPDFGRGFFCGLDGKTRGCAKAGTSSPLQKQCKKVLFFSFLLYGLVQFLDLLLGLPDVFFQLLHFLVQLIQEAVAFL